MSYKFNNKFAYSTFEEECRALNKPVNLLTFQQDSVWYKIQKDGIYQPEVTDLSWTCSVSEYKSYKEKLGYIPIWCFNPLQYGEDVSTVWKPEWFAGGSLWKSFLEFAEFDMSTIHTLTLMEIRVDSKLLIKDCVHDYGRICMIKEIRREQLVGCYRLLYPSEDDDNWFYPTIYPFNANTDMASFKHVQCFNDD